ncbi:hypothetical protein MACH16_03300 [Marinomonas pontica]|uniref:Uncharacterized protein n=1 Tax=Marinomonas pontica TaxID=264739 RepID=A0ABN6WJ88_9GAMM|nr:hypothetical protein MACH16_03300 [Marinomonas pontica]
MRDAFHDNDRKSPAEGNIIGRPERLVAQLGKVKPGASVIQSGDLDGATKEDGNALGLSCGCSAAKYFFQLRLYVVVNIIIAMNILV